MKNLLVCVLAVLSVMSLTGSLAAANELENRVVKAERTWKGAVYRDYSAHEQNNISQAFDHLQRAAHDCDGKLVTAQAKHDHAVKLGQECKKEWDAALSKLVSVITTDNKSLKAQAAAAAWNELASELNAAASSFDRVTGSLANEVGQNHPVEYIPWMIETAAQAEAANAASGAAAQEYEKQFGKAETPAPVH